MKHLLLNQRLVASLVVASMLSACGGNQLVKSNPPKAVNGTQPSAPSSAPTLPTEPASNASAPNASVPTSNLKNDATTLGNTVGPSMGTSGDDSSSTIRFTEIEDKLAAKQAQASLLQQAIAEIEKQLAEKRDEQGSFLIRAESSVVLLLLGAPGYKMVKSGLATSLKADAAVLPQPTAGQMTAELTADDMAGIQKEWAALRQNTENRSPLTITIKGEKVTFTNQGQLESFVHNEQRARNLRASALSEAKAARLVQLETMYREQRILELTKFKTDSYALYLANLSKGRKATVSSGHGKAALAVGAIAMAAVTYGSYCTYEWRVTRAEANRLEFLVLPNMKTDLIAYQSDITNMRKDLADRKGESIDSGDIAPGSDPITQGDAQ